MNGAFAFFDNSQHYALNRGPVYIWNPKDDTKVYLPHEKDEELRDFFVSPDHKWLAFAGDSSQSFRITVVAVDGTQIRNIVNAYHWFALLGWLGPHKLAVWMLSNVKLGRPFPTLIYDPFNRERELIMPNYPTIGTWWVPGWPETQTVYDPTLSLVAYVSQPQDNSGGEDIVLWSLQDKQEKTRLRLSAIGDNYNAPLWSPDGQEFVVDAKLEGHSYSELYGVSRTGEIRQLTHFQDLLIKTIVPDVMLMRYSWSPNGDQIAFWYRIGNESAAHLAVLDMGTGQLSGLCIMASHGDDVGGLPSPVWSPDGNSLLVDGLLPGNEMTTGYHAVLVNLVEQYTLEIAEHVIPVGWLSDEP